ncbi:hypothetical protein LTR97_006874 [Elasticomyces elasticus]|uniref:Uncharacterized protein n=1 Tax=Elasticomyces elasticus TaxID=574655 RepID=A0AAN7W9P2_9PEZI|nr:hypothetical protein LTR97_006874 [Elasticomyces elasticus]
MSARARRPGVKELATALGFTLHSGLFRRKSSINHSTLDTLLKEIDELKGACQHLTEHDINDSAFLKAACEVVIDRYGSDLWPDPPNRAAAEWLVEAADQVSTREDTVPLYWSTDSVQIQSLFYQLVRAKCVIYANNHRGATQPSKNRRQRSRDTTPVLENIRVWSPLVRYPSYTDPALLATMTDITALQQPVNPERGPTSEIGHTALVSSMAAPTSPSSRLGPASIPFQPLPPCHSQPPVMFHHHTSNPIGSTVVNNEQSLKRAPTEADLDVLAKRPKTAAVDVSRPASRSYQSPVNGTDPNGSVMHGYGASGHIAPGSNNDALGGLGMSSKRAGNRDVLVGVDFGLPHGKVRLIRIFECVDVQALFHCLDSKLPKSMRARGCKVGMVYVEGTGAFQKVNWWFEDDSEGHEWEAVHHLLRKFEAQGEKEDEPMLPGLSMSAKVVEPGEPEVEE